MSTHEAPPQNELALVSFLNNDEDQFEQAVRDGVGDVTVRIPGSHYSVFETACLTPGKDFFVEVCIECNPALRSQMNSTTEEYPIHLAARSMDKANLVALLRTNCDPQQSVAGSSFEIDRKYHDRTALLWLCEQLPDHTNRERAFECIKLLLRHGADINTTDSSSKDNVSPIELLLRAMQGDDRARHWLEQCLEHSTVEICSPTVRKQIGETFPDMTIPTKVVEVVPTTTTTTPVSKPSEQLGGGAVEGTTLAGAVRDGNLAAAKLLARKQMISGMLKPTLPLADMLVDCCRGGHVEMLAWLLRCIPDEMDGTTTEDVMNRHALLPLLVQQMFFSPDRSPFFQCMELLAADGRVEIDRKDKHGVTALQYAVSHGFEDAQELLLARGAYLGGEDRFGCPLVNELSPSLLERHLDACVTDIGRMAIDSDYMVRLCFANFLSPTRKQGAACGGKHDGNGGRNCAYDNEMLPIERIAQLPTTRRLLRHPVIASILLLKWLRISTFFYANLALCSLFFVCFICFLMFYYGAVGRRVDDPTEWFLLVPTLTGLGYIALRELFQCLLDFRAYIRSCANYVEVLLVATSGAVLTLHFTGAGSAELRNMVEVCAILLSTVEFTVLMATVPRLAFSTHMVMLKTVAKNFFQCLALYSVILVGFAISFHTMFRLPKDHDSVLRGPHNGTNATDDAGEEKSYSEFGTLALAFMKTAVMMTGELEASDGKLEQSWAFYIVFALFLFFVPIVLFNLMNGLAVSDTAAILAESELIALEQKICVINSCESILNTLTEVKSLCCKASFQKQPDGLMENMKYVHIKPNQGNAISEPCTNPKTMRDDIEHVGGGDGGGVPEAKKKVQSTCAAMGRALVSMLALPVRYWNGPKRIDQSIVYEALEILRRRQESSANGRSSAASPSADSQMLQEMLHRLSAELGELRAGLVGTMARANSQLAQEIKAEMKQLLFANLSDGAKGSPSPNI